MPFLNKASSILGRRFALSKLSHLTDTDEVRIKTVLGFTVVSTPRRQPQNIKPAAIINRKDFFITLCIGFSKRILRGVLALPLVVIRAPNRNP